MRKNLVACSLMLCVLCMDVGSAGAQAQSDEEEVERLRKQARLSSHCLALREISVGLWDKTAAERDRLLFDRPRAASPQTELFKKMMALCSEDGMQSSLFSMIAEDSVTDSLKEALVYGIANNPHRAGIIEGFEAVLLDPDAMVKYPTRVRAAVVCSLMNTCAVRGIQPSEKTVDHVLANDLSSDARLFVVQELGRFGRKWYPLLAGHIKSEEKELRYGAMEGLQMMYVQKQIDAKELETNLKWLIENEDHANNRYLAVMMYGTHLRGERHEDYLYSIATEKDLHRNEKDTIEAAVDRLMACADNRKRAFETLEKLAVFSHPFTQDAAIGALCVWPDSRKQALQSIERLLAWARKDDEDNLEKLNEERIEKGLSTLGALLEQIQEPIVTRLRFVPDMEGVSLLENLMYSSPFDNIQQTAPMSIVECMQNDEVGAILEKATREHEDAFVAEQAMRAYSLLKGMEADEFLKTYVIKTKNPDRQKRAIGVLGQRGWEFGPRCKALEALRYLKKIAELSHLSKELDEAISRALNYKPENFTAFLDAIERAHGYWATVWADTNPDNPAAKAGMESERGRQRAKALRGLYDKFF
ncbi:MAG: hypothetical protein RDV41_14780, partial [Planctomycetota bacterium]|nr:hypothetical protein [Planctomycetota bacterium]